jgi:hypothetical protein
LFLITEFLLLLLQVLEFERALIECGVEQEQHDHAQREQSHDHRDEHAQTCSDGRIEVRKKSDSTSRVCQSRAHVGSRTRPR